MHETFRDRGQEGLGLEGAPAGLVGGSLIRTPSDAALPVSSDRVALPGRDLQRAAQEQHDGGLARCLQRCGLAISPTHHARHHAPPHDVSYCVTNGWVNSVTDRFQF